jgi:DNA replication protein DnaC
LASFTRPRTEEGECIDCGTRYEKHIYARADGSEVPDLRCPHCEDVRERQRRAEQHALELAEAQTRQRQAWRDGCGVPDRFRSATFESFKGSANNAARDAMSSWDGQTLVLSSPPGTYGVGKTHLAAALANKLIETCDAAVSIQGYVMRMPRPVWFTNEQLLMERIRSTYGDGARETDEQIYLALERLRLLIIDDIGKDSPRDLSFVQRVWFRIIDGRYGAQRPLVLTTNLDRAEFEQHIGGASADRLMQMCGPKGLIAMRGTSYRRRTA